MNRQGRAAVPPRGDPPPDQGFDIRRAAQGLGPSWSSLGEGGQRVLFAGGLLFVTFSFSVFVAS